MAKGAGKRKGSRKAARKPVQLHPSMLLHAAEVTFCVIAWGYLVSAAIDFGSTARSGRSEAWLFLAVACIGAACCLFAGLMLAARLLRALGITSGPPERQAPPLPGGVAESTYTSHSAHPHGSHASKKPVSGVSAPHASEPTPAPRHPGGHRRAHR